MSNYLKRLGNGFRKVRDSQWTYIPPTKISLVLGLANVINDNNIAALLSYGAMSMSFCMFIAQGIEKSYS